jgi:hypothetical protein
MTIDTPIAHRNEPMACAWYLMLAALQGEPGPSLPALPGRRHACTDAPISEDELQGVTSPTELALLLGITRQAAMQRLRRQAERHGDPD